MSVLRVCAAGDTRAWLWVTLSPIAYVCEVALTRDSLDPRPAAKDDKKNWPRMAKKSNTVAKGRQETTLRGVAATPHCNPPWC
jgi:hypothetical protein